MSFGFVQAHEIARFSTCVLAPPFLNYCADALRNQSNFLGKVCSYSPIASTPYVLEINVIYCIATLIFNEVQAYQNKEDREDIIIKSCQQGSILLVSTALGTLITPLINVKSLEMENIELAVAFKATIILAIVHLALNALKITPKREKRQPDPHSTSPSGTPSKAILPPPPTLPTHQNQLSPPKDAPKPLFHIKINQNQSHNKLNTVTYDTTDTAEGSKKQKPLWHYDYNHVDPQDERSITGLDFKSTDQI
jgi:hypothetical protein